MKHIKYLIFVFLLLTMNFSLLAEGNHNHYEKIKNENSISEYDIQLSKAQTVYICTGVYAYAYHSRSDCPGLNNCKGQINYTDEYSAVNSFGRRPCCRCWSNVSGNCKDDNPSYGGGSDGGGENSEAYAYLALAIVATSAIILSNDFYFYPAYSFYKGGSKNNYYGQQSNNGNGTGWIFGFRKTFKHSALEYGASYLKFETNYNYGYGYTNTMVQNRWGGHFNFVHQLFYNKTPEWLKVYFGPSLNYVYDFGFGGIIGSEMKLFDRLRFDVRYEWTSQTNQIQAGLIFTYQKKYFWQKNK
jgi:hypothetical protein